MKALDELTDQELVDLDIEEIAQHVDWLCAMQGIPFEVDLPPRPTNANRPQPDKMLYSVGGIHFEKEADAVAVANLAGSFDRWDGKYESIGGDYQSVMVPHFDPILVAANRHVTRDNCVKYAAARADFAARNAAYEKAQMEFARVQKDRQRVADEVAKTIQAARNRVGLVDSYRSKFERYLELAGGQRAIAARFFENTYPAAREIYPEAFDCGVAEIPQLQTKRSYDGDEDSI